MEENGLAKIRFPKAKVSIVVLAYDNVEYLEKTLVTLRDHTDFVNFEMVISSNAVEVPLAKEIREFCLQFASTKTMKMLETDVPSKMTYIRNDENLLHGKGCMEGFKQVDPGSEYICFCNDDIFIPASKSDWLARLANFMEERPNVASVTPALYSAREKVYWIGKQDPEKPHHDFLHFPRGDLRLPTEPLTTYYNNFAIILVRRFLVEEFPIGQNCPHYGSDSEFANRIKEKYPEMLHYVIPGIKLYHYNIYNKRFNRGKDKRVEG